MNLRLTMKQRLAALLEGVAAERKLLVVDRRALQVVDAVLTLTDILDCGILLVESLEKKRQPYPSMHAVYLFSPDGGSAGDGSDSIARIVADFEGRATPAYAHAHLFAINDISADGFARLTGCVPLAQRVLTVQQVYADFVATEARAFHFGARPSTVILRPGDSSLGAAAMSELDRTARRLFSVWTALGERPAVRYHRSDDDVLAARLASLLQEYFRSAGSSDSAPGGPPSNYVSSSGSEVIIVGRAFDMATPLLHDFAYQAMAADLVGIQTAEGALAFSADGGRSVRALDEGDALWQALRHTHIARCSDTIVHKFRDFTADNKAARTAVASRAGGKTEGGDGTLSLEDLKALLNELGEFQDMKAMFGLHLRLANECLRAMNERRLMDVAAVEQNLATARSADGNTCRASSQWPAVLDLLAKPFLQPSDRVRLAALYGLATGSVEERALERAGLSPADIRTVTAIRDVGHRALARRLPQRRSKLDPEPEYDVSRFHSTAKFVLEAAQLGVLDEADYPYAAGKPAGAAGGPSSAAAAGVSLRSGGAKGATAAATLPAGSRRIIMLFVIGPVSHAEIKVAYDNATQGLRLGASAAAETIVGGTHIAPPEAFLQDYAGADGK